MDLDNTIVMYSFASDVERFSDDRGLGWGIPSNGWQAFVDGTIRRHIGNGYTRFELHNPAGRTITRDENDPPDFRWPMDFDQFFIAQREDHIDALAHDKFVEAWKPITDEGHEVIAYLGSLTDSPGMKNLPPDQWFWRAWASLNTPLDAG